MFKTRIGILSVLFGMSFFVVLCRLFQLQIINYERYHDLATRDHSLERIVKAPRGTLYDRHGNVLAEDRTVYDISLRVERLKLDRVGLGKVADARRRYDNEKTRDPESAKVVMKNEFERLCAMLEQEKFVRELAHMVRREPADIAAGVLKAFDTVARNWATPKTPLSIVSGVDERIWLALRAAHEDVFHDSHQLFGKVAAKMENMVEPPFPGLVCTLSTQRVYPQGRLACFVLGAVGELSAADEDALKTDGILLDNAQSRRQFWNKLRDSMDETRATSLERILRAPPQEIHNLGGLYDIISKLRPSELQAVTTLGLAEPVRWLERPPRLKLTDTENLYLGVGLSAIASRRMLPDRLLGEQGIERYYNNNLRGKHGLKLRESLTAKNEDDRSLSFHRASQPQAGDSMALCISLPWQKAVEHALKSQDRPGVAVVLNIRNGEALALASFPDFDPNLFTPPRDNPQRQEQLRAVLTDPTKPLLNRAVSEQYALGSCMKSLIAAVALEKNLVDPQEIFECPGYIVAGGQKFHCDDSRAHGSMNLLKAIRCSCNVTFHQIGARIGVENLGLYAKQFFGRVTGIDLPGEVRGIYPDREWRFKTFPNNPAARIWTRGNDFLLAIGQGQFACTVIQSATLMAAIANGGQVVTPRLWLDGPVVPTRPLGISQANLNIVKQGLEEVVNVGRPGERGTAYSPFHEQGPELAVRVAGKTSSAEHKKGAKPHAWFCGYVPADNPQYAFAFFLEGAGHGGAVAAPLAYRVLREIYGTRAAPKNPNALQVEVSPTSGR
ncbi:MAG: penicillin-binding transpeptidase domain-containing protein [Planctomycetota bacterium]